VRHLVEQRWPFRLHATYDETIERALNVYEEVNKDIPFGDLHWNFDHCETISDRSIERVKKLGGGIAVQSRMAFQGEYFAERYGAAQAARTRWERSVVSPDKKPFGSFQLSRGGPGVTKAPSDLGGWRN
jgi:predicted amidohydrolase YtcJ